MRTGRERVLKAISYEQRAVAPINIEGVYNLSPFLEWFDVGSKQTFRERLDVDVFGARLVYFGDHSRLGLDAFGAILQR